MSGRIADELAIRTLQQAYFHSVDAKDWGLFASLLTEQAMFDFSAAVDPTLAPVRGRQTIVDFVRKSMSAITSAHHGFLRKLEFSGKGTARALWAMEDRLWHGEPGSLTKYMHGHGHYQIGYSLVGGEWKICDWKLTRVHVDLFD